ncbi:MAG: Smr/MutS family protein [Geobacteraceae bacterium]|nr:Smr/MutS family protein [Geobacteraceae bacterium]
MKHPAQEDNPESSPREPGHDDIDFATAMGGIGVEPLDDNAEYAADEVPTEQGDDAEQHTRESSFHADELSEEELFLHHLGQMDAVFNDSYPENDAAAQEHASARRMRQLRKGRLRPEASLDLHGCYREEARKKVRVFLESRQRQGMKTVLIITGRGLRSKDGESVLRSDIEAYLRTRAKAWVAEWGRAPKQYGGDGALVVFLRT